MAEEIVFYPEQVCSTCIRLSIDGDILKDVVFEDGCEGNLTAICRLVKGMPVKDVVARLKGIDCGAKGTSCPDQLSIALEQAAQKKAGALSR